MLNVSEMLGWQELGGTGDAGEKMGNFQGVSPDSANRTTKNS